MKKLLFVVSLLVITSNLNAQTVSIPSMSAWDGVAHSIKKYLKENANDPKSIKYIECSYMLKYQNGLFGQRVKFRGKNAFGALVINEYFFLIKGVNFDAKVISMGTLEEYIKLESNGTLKLVAKYDSDGKKVYD